MEALARISLLIRFGTSRTGRIYLDSEFTREQAANRYANWMMDGVLHGASVYELRFKSVGIGFFLFRHDSERIGYPALAGLYPSSDLLGFGNVLLYQVLVEGKKRHLRRIESHLFSNSIAILRNHIEQGFKVTNIQYVFVRHQK